MKPTISVTDPSRGWTPSAILACTDGTTTPDVVAWAAGYYTARDCRTICHLLDGAPGPLDPLIADAPGGPLAGAHLLSWDPRRHARFDEHGLRVVEGARYDGAERRFVSDGTLITAVTYAEMAVPLRTLPPWFLAKVHKTAARVAELDAEAPDHGPDWHKTDAGQAWADRWGEATDHDADLVVEAWRNCRPDSRERLMKRADHQPDDLLELLAAGGGSC